MKMPPAQLETMCMQYSTVQELLDALLEKRHFLNQKLNFHFNNKITNKI